MDHARLKCSVLSWFMLAAIAFINANSPAQQIDRVYETGQRPNDIRIAKLKDLNGHFPFQAPQDRDAWIARADQLKQRIRVATGLWPMPEKTPLNPVVHGKVKRDGFTVEKVYFESVPNHFVTGLLFRPDQKIRDNEKRPAVLCPHGHGGRLQDHGVDGILKLIASGDEKFEQSGRFPKIARCAHLARMGCVVFIFDMLGYGDSQQIPNAVAHRLKTIRPELEGNKQWGLFSAQSDLRCQNIMGIQTWNAIRCLDFLQQLPDVDPNRIGVTGNSGGGTQTILLCAIDPRPIVAFPNGMVSTSMQGGCTCENCNYLRIGSGNVELAALFAPKPQGMSAANDWTIDMMTDGYPQLQTVYEMFGAKGHVVCHDLRRFNHNFNAVTREKMYALFKTHLNLPQSAPIEETDFPILTTDEQSVWSEKHPQPAGGVEYERSLTKQLTAAADEQFKSLHPHDSISLKTFREIVGGAYTTIVHRDPPRHTDIERTKVDEQDLGDFIVFKDKIRLDMHQEEIPVISLYPVATKWNGEVVIWIDGDGKSAMFDADGGVRSEIRELLSHGCSVVAADLFQQGEFLAGELLAGEFLAGERLVGDKLLTQQRVVENPRPIAAYTYCYNDPLFVQRVHDVLTLVAWVDNDEHSSQKISLLATGSASQIGAVARIELGSKITKAALMTAGFRFGNIIDYRDSNFLPGSVKYGDMPGILAMSAPHPLLIGGEHESSMQLVSDSYAAAGEPDAVVFRPSGNLQEAIDWLIAK